MEKLTLPVKAKLIMLLFISVRCIFSTANAQVNLINGIVNQYTKATNIAGNVVTVNNNIFVKYDQALLIQMDAPNFNAYAGNYEFARVVAVNNLLNTVTLDSINNIYDYQNSNVQMILVANVGNCIVNGLLTCAAYNPATGLGGVLAISTCDPAFNPNQSNLNLQANIDVTGKGFTGAVNNALLVNGNGANPLSLGGNNVGGAPGYPGGGFGNMGGGGGGAGGVGGGAGGMMAGGGGGTAAAGGAGGANGGNAAGTGTFNKINKVFMGAGGGYEIHKVGGNAGNGGGIIFIFADSIFGNGNFILADGGPSANQACLGGNYIGYDHFGGGGGGSVVIRNTGGFYGNLTLSAAGGNSNSCNEIAGGGGGGGIWTDAVLPMNVATNVAGGISINALPNTQNGGAGLVIAGPGNPLYLDGDTSQPIQGLFCKTIFTLPVELLSFNGERRNEDAYIHWETASEESNNYFVLQKSYDGNNFESIERLNGAGNSTSLKSYSYLDKNAFKSGLIVYYRFIQVDFNGKEETSKIIAIKKNPDTEGDNITIKSLKDQLILTVYNRQNENYIINLLDYTGKIIYSRSFHSSYGYNQMTISSALMSKGLYTLYMIGTEKTVIKKVILE